MVTNTLERILEPCPVEEFLDSSWGKSYAHVRGRAGKFAHLLPWAQLNEILRRHRLDFPRLRLAKDGKTLPSSAHLRHVQGGRGRGTVPRLLPTELTRRLRQGATLVLDAVDELYEPLEDLALGLELTFHERVQINSYAGWRTSHGFDVHWDDHDVFILQVAGRKLWKIYGMTRPYPVQGDPEPSPRPEGNPLWEGTLEDGDLLYVPRGWWHVALPLDEPTLHLTVGVHNRTGLDLLRWLSDRMRTSEAFRRDLPRFASDEQKVAHAARLREELLVELTDDVVARFQSAYDAMAEPRPQLSLPWSATPEVLPPSDTALVRWLVPRELDLKVENGVMEFSANRKLWRFAAAALPVLSRLAEGRTCYVSELREAAGGTLDAPTVRAFVGELILHGLVAIVDDSRQ